MHGLAELDCDLLLHAFAALGAQFGNLDVVEPFEVMRDILFAFRE